jgi:hypothetical protein
LFSTLCLGTLFDQMTRLSSSSLRCPELERDVLASLDRSRAYFSSETGVPPTAEQVFRAEMTAVTEAIAKRSRFALLKRFIAHGSKLPSWETKFQDSPGHLSDDELAVCVNFVTGHMVSKFQGKLAEMLAAAPISDLAAELIESGELPAGGSLVFGSSIRCASSGRSGSDDRARGVEGPDAMYIRSLPGEGVEARLLAEVKSYVASAARLRAQLDGHLRALRRGVALKRRWISSRNLRVPRGGPQRVFIQPTDWPLTRNYRLEADRNGVEQVLMEEQSLPAGTTSRRKGERGEWMIRLAWSRDALRAAAFRLMHCYMGEVGEALAVDPKEGIRKDMTPTEAGENNFLAQLYVAIFRQQEAEPDARRRGKTLELYNVLGFGWALGHGFRDLEGDLSMMFHEDLRAASES